MELAQAGGSGEAHLYMPTISASSTSPAANTGDASSDQSFAKSILQQALIRVRDIKVEYSCDDDQAGRGGSANKWEVVYTPAINNLSLLSGELSLPSFMRSGNLHSQARCLQRPYFLSKL